jgi:hypothetical protein
MWGNFTFFKRSHKNSLYTRTKLGVYIYIYIYIYTPSFVLIYIYIYIYICIHRKKDERNECINYTVSLHLEISLDDSSLQIKMETENK